MLVRHAGASGRCRRGATALLGRGFGLGRFRRLLGAGWRGNHVWRTGPANLLRHKFVPAQIFSGRCGRAGLVDGAGGGFGRAALLGVAGRAKARPGSLGLLAFLGLPRSWGASLFLRGVHSRVHVHQLPYASRGQAREQAGAQLFVVARVVGKLLGGGQHILALSEWPFADHG